MDTNSATKALSALSQATRLEVFRLLIKAGPTGMPVGDLVAALGVRQNTLSANLAVLLHAGLVRNEREGRSIRYFADMAGLGALLSFVLQDCCGGRAEMCAPLIDDIVSACSPADLPRGRHADGQC